MGVAALILRIINKDMETAVLIKWDKPEDQDWLCAYNIQIALGAHCKNTKFEVIELKEPSNLLERYVNHILEVEGSSFVNTMKPPTFSNEEIERIKSIEEKHLVNE